MIFSTKNFGYDFAAHNETLFTVGNGNLGFRGDTEEKSGTFHKGTYINGFYDTEEILYGENAYGYAKNHETILNLPDSKRIELNIDGKEFGIGGGTITDSVLELDTRRGILCRRTKWNSAGESAVDFFSERLVSFHRPECAVIRCKVKNLSDKTEKIVLKSFIDTESANILAEEDPRIGAKFRHKPLLIDSTESCGDTLTFSAHTAKSALFIAGSVMHIFEYDENASAIKIESEKEKARCKTGNIPEYSESFELPANSSFTLTKYIAYVHGSTSDNLLEKAVKLCKEFKELGFNGAAKEQKDFLDEFWDKAEVKIEGDKAAEEALEFNLFHLLQSAGRDGKTSIAAKGLTSEGYEGHYFWDTESYVCPVFTYTAPKIAKSLLEYRFSILDTAKIRAKIMTLDGALFPWRTISGNEASAYYPAGTAQYHINADIVFALERYNNAHGDFDSEKACEMCLQSARMYSSLVNFSEEKNKFCVNDVTGPDEYTAIVNNNAFTNFMIRETLEIALRRAANCASNQERSQWKNIAENIYIPFYRERGIYPQDDSFMSKAAWDFAHTPKENYPLLLHYHPLVIYRHRVLKQPDLVLAQFLLSGRFSRAEKIRNFDFYEPYTTGDSSLSHCIMSIMAAECGNIQKAEDYFNKTVRMDIDDVNGNSRDGIHTACMAGSWMSTVYGFAGFRDYGGKYSFAPQLPAKWKNLSFSLCINGAVLDVRLSHDKAVYFLREDSKNDLDFTHRNISVHLKPGEEKSFSLKRKLGAVLFDLDGVITDTSELHFKAWQEFAHSENLHFDRNMNKKLLGISREASLEVILSENNVVWEKEKKDAACKIKNLRYIELLKGLSPNDIYPGILQLLKDLKKHKIPAVLASSSKNAPEVISRLELSEYFTALADANTVQKAKPEPDIFLSAAEISGAWYTDCIGIEDAQAGIAAIKKAGMVAIGVSADKNLRDADIQLGSTAELNYELLAKLMDDKLTCSRM